MPIKKQKLELTWIGKYDWEAVEPRIFIEQEYFGERKRLKNSSKNKENLLIHSENLLGMRAFQKEYHGKVKCIYIDPPYNTKSSKSCLKHYEDRMEHSLWLNMMKERLSIMHKLLKEDGSIWISIDDGECHYLKVMCDEIFGRDNFVDAVVWERAYSPVSLKKRLSCSHDYILVYAKNIKGLSFNKLPRTKKANNRYKNPDNDPRGLWKSSDLSVGPIVEKQVYPIITPSGREVWPPQGYCWRLTKERLKEMIADNRIWFGKNGDNVPSIKRFLSEVAKGIVSTTLWKREDVGDSEEAKKEVKKLNPEDVFETPKPERLIHRILLLATNQGDLVLDSFAGSGTTGAVAHKMGRRWIMIEMENTVHTHIIPRMKKVISDEDQGGVSNLVGWKGGGGFRFCELAPSLIKEYTQPLRGFV